MAAEENSNPSAVDTSTPTSAIEERDPRLTRPEPAAAGIPAVVIALKHISNDPGLLRGAGLLLRVNQFEGFDCPGCAWPEPDTHRSVAEFCENGAKAIAEEASKDLVTPDFFARWSVAKLSEQSDFWIGKRGRIEQPMVLPEGATHYQPISWQDAFALIGNELNALASPDEAAFYTSGRTSNEAAFLYQLFVRQYGTNNLPDCSNMCHESSGAGLTETIGRGKGTVTLEDFEHSDAIFVIGQNPGTNHPRMLMMLQAAAKRGCKIVSVNPLFETGLAHFKNPRRPLDLLSGGTQIATLHIPVRINGDVPFFKGVMKEMLEAERRNPGTVVDHEFVEQHTSGFENFKRSLDGVEWRDIVEQSGLTREQIRAAADIAIHAKRMICCWAMGITQHKNGVANVQEIVNFLLLRGQFGKPGAGACPVRGHSNVQGDRTMGIWEKAPTWFLDSLGKEFDFNPPREHGLDTVETIRAMHERQVKVFFALGGNFLSAAPDTYYTAEALRRCSLTVHVSTKLNRSHLITGKKALILPVMARTDADTQVSGPQFVTTENSMAVVQSSRGRLKPASSHWLSECALVAGLAKATLGDRSAVDWDWHVADYDRIRDRIARVVPGFERYNERARQHGGFYLPNPIRQHEFLTAEGKARFTIHPLPNLRLTPDKFLLTTIRSHDQFNTTVYGLDDRYRGIHSGRRVVLLNALDCEEFGWKQGDLIDLTSHYQGEERHAPRFAVYPYDIPRRCAATYFPEANVLVPIDYRADISNTPASKSLIVSLRRSIPHPESNQ